MGEMKQVLLLDDDPKVATLLREPLAELRLELVQADSAEAALKKIAAHPPELVILCVELKSENGYLLFKKLKKDAVAARLPIIITSSARTAAEDFKKHAGLQQPAAGYIEKPFSLFDLLDMISVLAPFPLPEAGPTLSSQVQQQGLEEELAALRARLQELEEAEPVATDDGKIQELEEKHKKALNALRDFYRQKLEQVQSTADEAEAYREQLAALQATIDDLQQQLQKADADKQSAVKELEREREVRRRISAALGNSDV